MSSNDKNKDIEAFNSLIRNLYKKIDKIKDSILKTQNYQDYNIFLCYSLKKKLNYTDTLLKLLELKYGNKYNLSTKRIQLDYYNKSIDNIEIYMRDMIEENQEKIIGIITFINLIYTPPLLIVCFLGMNLDHKFDISFKHVIFLCVMVIVIILTIIKTPKLRNSVNNFIFKTDSELTQSNPFI